MAATATAAATCPPAAQQWETLVAEDSPEAPEQAYEEVGRALDKVRDERLAFRPDLNVELQAAKEQVIERGGYRTLVKALGIPRTALIEAGGLGLLRVTAEGRYFTPSYENDKDSRLALIVPVWSGQGGDLIDLLAVRTDQPARFYVRNGYAKSLGEWDAAEIRDATTLWPLPGDVHPSLVLAPNPLMWLRGDCAGTCILNVAWLEYSLVGVRSVTAHNRRHAAALHKLLSWPTAPRIFLREDREAA